MQKLIFLLGYLFLIFTINSYAQTPALLSSTIAYDSNQSQFGNQSGYLAVSDIQAAYNHARRMEELQFCIPTNSITNLVMPTQSVWNAMNSDERFLFLINAERTARAGLNYCVGDGPVAGLPFTGVEANIDNIAQAHAEELIATQSTTSISQASNIDANPNIGGSGCNGLKGMQSNCCHTFVPFSVYRIYFTSDDTPANSSTITTPGIEVRSVFFLVYGSGALGNGRKMILTQNIEPGGSSSNPCGFVDDYGDNGDEGFIGIGMQGGIPNPSFNRSHIDMVILSYFDPVPQENGCNYSCTTCDPCMANVTLNSNSIASGNYQASNSINSAGKVLGSNTVAMSASNFVSLNETFEVKNGGVFQASIDACYFRL